MKEIISTDNFSFNNMKWIIKPDFIKSRLKNSGTRIEDFILARRVKQK